MKRKYFLRNFFEYCRLMMIPLLLLFLASMLLVTFQMQKDLRVRAENTLANVDTSLDFVVRNVIFQNDQLTNNPSMLLSLKKLLLRQPGIDYSEAIYLRNIKTLMRSITQTYPYVDSVYLYLDGYDSFFSSESAVTRFRKEEDVAWREVYLEMDEKERNHVTVIGNGGQEMLTVFQRMLLLEGVVVMNIDIEKYQNLLTQILYSNHETILFYNREGEYLFKWNTGEENDLERLPLSTFEGSEGRWMRVGRKLYMVNESSENSYHLTIVSLISQDVIWENVKGIASFFFLVLGISTAVMMYLAYRTAKESFDRIEYMVNVFQDAELGRYPTEPKKEEKNEYDVVLNNIIYLFLHNMQLNNSLIQKQQEQEIAELTALQLQINPHFLFNVLQNVAFETKKLGKGADAASRMIEDLSEILQYALKDPMETITLRQEIEYLKKYVAIQQLRFGDDFIVYYEIDEELWDFPVFRLMLQPLVENSIVHGIRPSHGIRPVGKGYIKVKVFERGGRVHFRVIDNGIGMTAEEIEAFQDRIQRINVRHIGMSNVNSRLRIYYGEGSAIHVKSRKNRGCVVEFYIPADVKSTKKEENCEKKNACCTNKSKNEEI